MLFFANDSLLLRENGRLARRAEEEIHPSKIRRSLQCRQGSIAFLSSYISPVFVISWGVWESDFICSLLFVWTGIFRIVLERFLVGLGCVSFESNFHMCWLNEEILSDDRILKFVCQISTFCFGKFGCLRPKLHVIFFIVHKVYCLLFFFLPKTQFFGYYVIRSMIFLLWTKIDIREFPRGFTIKMSSLYPLCLIIDYTLHAM